jgi:hypothetical protein
MEVIQQFLLDGTEHTIRTLRDAETDGLLFHVGDIGRVLDMTNI